MSDESSLVERSLGPGGLVSQRLEQFEQRPAQLQMAHAVRQALADGEHLLVEAGTGTGKSFAYLVPLIEATAAEGIKAVVSSCGFNAFRWYYRGDLKGWSHAGYMPKIPSYGGWKNMPFDFHEVVAALAPRPFFVNAPLKDSNFEVRGVTEAVEAARPVYRLPGAADKLKVIHPDCGHDFPDDVREQVYTWLDRELGHSKR